jgi:hypothetical protein
MQGMVTAAIMLSQVMYLGMAVVTRGDGILSPSGSNLVVLQLTVFTALFGKSRLQKTTAAAATIIVGFIRRHINEIFCADNLLHHITQIICNRIAKRFSDELAWILNGKRHFQVFIPVGVDRQLAFPDPFCVILNDAGYLKIVLDVEFFQSGPDCK